MLKDLQKNNESITPNSAFLSELQSKLPDFFTADKYNDEGNLVTKGGFDIIKFQNALKERNIQELSSGYQLDFIGKDYAKKQAGEKSNTLIVPDIEHNILPENKHSNNIFLTGDNLEVLRHLQNNYENSIDMIYIDPPYNTGSDGFVYPDSFEYSDQNLQAMFGLNDFELQRLKSIQGKATHSAWLTFIYPRIWLAKKLLKENGVILLSIDDNEHANLQLLLDEIFGEGNKLPTFVWQNKKGGGNDSVHVADEIEFVLAYAKNINAVPKLYEAYNPEYAKRYKEEDNISKYYWDTFKRKSGKQYYPITTPDGTVLEHDENGNEISWLRSKARFQQDLIDNEVKFIKDKNGNWNVHFKQRMPLGKKPRNIISDKGTTSSGSAEIMSYFGSEVFQNPKPTTLIKYFISFFTEDNSIILDFFAGSGSTADAVMKINLENSGQRRFLTVQLPEQCEEKTNAKKSGYNTIDEISRERIKRAANKIRQENPDTKLDLGFKHYLFMAPKQQTLEDLDSFDIETGNFVNASGQLTAFTESGFNDMIEPFSSKGLGIVGGAKGEDTILTTWLVSDGYKMDISAQKIDFSGYKATYVDGTRLYLIEEKWYSVQTQSLLNQIGTNRLPVQTIVIYGYSFELESIRELEIGLKQLEQKVNLVKRY